MSTLQKEQRSSGASRPQAGRDALGAFLHDLARHPLPSAEEQLDLARRVAEGDEEARREMIAANLRLVIHWARRYQDRGVDMIDLIQEGTFGLMRAVDKFDWRKGFKFSTYATWWIRQSLQRAVQQGGRTIRIPMEVAEQIQRADSARWELANELHRPAAEEEVADAAGMPLGALRSLDQHAHVVASLDQPAGADSTTSLGELLPPESEGFEEDVESELMREQVREAVDHLDELERAVVRLRFGFGGTEPVSLQNTAKYLGVGVRKVRQAEASALAKLAESNTLAAASEAA